jgi:hypothetical protein
VERPGQSQHDRLCDQRAEQDQERHGRKCPHAAAVGVEASQREDNGGHGGCSSQPAHERSVEHGMERRGERTALPWHDRLIERRIGEAVDHALRRVDQQAME